MIALLRALENILDQILSTVKQRKLLIQCIGRSLPIYTIHALAIAKRFDGF